jgi:hypothetical protein
MEPIRENWTTAQTAKRIGYASGAALEVKRCRGEIDLPFIRIGKRGIRYDPQDVEKWLEARKVTPDPVPAPRARSRSAAIRAIKAALAQNKFLWSMVEQATRLEIKGHDLHILFAPQQRSLAEMLQARDPMERMRKILDEVVRPPLRVCVAIQKRR